MLIKLRKNISSFPREVLEKKDLKELEIIGGQLHSIPEEIASLPLKSFKLKTDGLCHIPIQLLQLPGLERLAIKNTPLQLPHLDSLPGANLKELILSGCQLTQFPKWLEDCHQLTLLDFSQNKLTHFPAWIKSLNQLQRLNLDSNQIEHIPEALQSLKNLNHLSLDQNPLTEIARQSLYDWFGIWF